MAQHSDVQLEPRVVFRTGARALTRGEGLGIASFVRPSERATLMATEIPRALNDPVGLRPSSLIQTLGNSRLGSRGVKPSPSVAGGTFGRASRYRQRLASLPRRDSGLKFPFKVCRSYRGKRIPASCGQTFCGISAGSPAPHLVHSR